jgi:PKD repeat protein
VIDISNDKIIKQYTGNVFSHSFEQKGRYNIQLKVKDAAGNEDSDTQIIHVNSRAPVAEFAYSIPNKSKPNRVLLDGTKSFDSDITDAGKLKYRWNINGEIVNIENIDTKGAIGYYTFDSIGDQNVTLEVSDPDDMTSTKSQKVRIDSILEVDLATYPRVVQRGGYIKFVASAPSAKIYEWDFGDGSKENGSSGKIDHVYAKSGIYNVKLTVRDSDGAVNDITKTVYV